jgi:hypothetical protein
MARDTDGRAAVGLWCADGVDTELGQRVVPNVIVVDEPCPQPEAKVCQAHLMGIVTAADASALGHSVLFPWQAERVEVGSGPPAGDVEDRVQVSDSAVTTEEPTAPDHRAHAQQHALEWSEADVCGG